MWGAASLRTTRAVLALGFALALTATAADRVAAAPLPTQLWPVTVGKINAEAATTQAYLQKLRRHGVNALVLDDALSPAQRNRLRAAAKRSGLIVVQPVGRTVANSCAGVCAVRASSPTAAVRLAKTDARLVVVRVRGPRDARYLKGVQRGRILVVPVLANRPRFDAAAWNAAIASARSDQRMDLAVASTGPASLNAYLSLLSTTRATSRAPGSGGPAMPKVLRALSQTDTSIMLGWKASAGATKYAIYRDGTPAGISAVNSAPVTALTCNTSYVLEVESISASGARSARAAMRASTNACAEGGGGGGGDTTAPTAPTAVTQTAAAATGATIMWGASLDNVGVARYDLYKGGTYAGTSAGVTFSFAGLSCGTSYAVGVEAVDAAGNRSAQANGNIATSACAAGDSVAPSVPSGLSTTASTQTTVTVSWTASTDDVLVTGYGRYRNGALVSSDTGTSHSFTGLTCGTSYTFGVDAYDAAGNRSAGTTLFASTSACPAPAAAGARYVSVSGSDSGQCTQAAPCASFMRAYTVASAGETVEVAAGTYPTQIMTRDSTKTSSFVTFRPAAGATVTVYKLQLEGASHVAFRDMTLSTRMVVENSDPGTTGSHDVLFENLRAQTFRFVGQISNITVRGGEFGSTVDNQPQLKKYNQSDPDSSRPANILIEDAWFHDFRRSGSAVHTECLQIINANTVVVRRNRFNVCDGTGAIGITDGPTDNLTIENNFFGKGGDAYYAVQITKSTRNLVFRNNSLAKGFIFSDTESGGPYTVVGNYAPHNSSTCTSGATYRWNVFAGGTCGSTDLGVAALRFVNENGFDLHLRADSEAIGRGDATSYPSTDIDGDARPSAGTADAGADEF